MALASSVRLPPTEMYPLELNDPDGVPVSVAMTAIVPPVPGLPATRLASPDMITCWSSAAVMLIPDPA